jgi:hypothetical protein
MGMDSGTVATLTTNSLTLASGRTPSRVRPLRHEPAVCVEAGAMKSLAVS